MKNSFLPACLIFLTACSPTGDGGQVRLAVLDPGHFHAALVQKSSIDGVSDTVKVYAPEGPELRQYLSLIESYNSRDRSPASWYEDVYAGADYLEKAVTERKADAVVLAGNNRLKSEYILEMVKAGYNVLADKPMAIDTNDFAMLEEAYRIADSSGLVIYELMTERYDTLNMTVRSLVNDRECFGTMSEGTEDNPSVYMKSVHHFYKNVSEEPLTRPQWYYDVRQQGEGIADVTTHLIDLVMWQCFPDRPVDFRKDVRILDAGHYPTRITPDQFRLSTGADRFPDYLSGYVRDGILEVCSNGFILFRIDTLTVRLEVIWDFEAPAGTGDTFTAVYRGTEGLVEVVQDESTDYVKQVFITGRDGVRRMIDIPCGSRSGHEEHFNKVTEKFLEYLSGTDMPLWEKENTLSKYMITTSAVKIASAADRAPGRTVDR